MHRAINHEITVLLFETDVEGTPLLYDIIETDRHNASAFARRAYRNPIFTHIAAIPHGHLFNLEFWTSSAIRPINR